MLENLIKKIDIDINCELTIEQLKLLYSIDNEVYEELIEYRDKRDNYEDFITMFGKDKLATTLKEININTVAYIGESLLIMDAFASSNISETYNLRYVYGNFTYVRKEIIGLENLEIVYGNCTFFCIDNCDDLLNLQKVFGTLSLNIISNQGLFVDLSLLEYVRKLELIYSEALDLSNVLFPKKMQELSFDSASLRNLKLLKNLKELKKLHFSNCCIENDVLPIPESSLELSIKNTKIKRIDYNNNLKKISLIDLIDIKYLILPKELDILDISLLSTLSGKFKELPGNLKELHSFDRAQLESMLSDIKTIPKNLKVFIGDNVISNNELSGIINEANKLNLFGARYAEGKINKKTRY